MWAMRRVVVLLPFVPVMATIGILGRGRCASGPSAVARRPASSRRSVERPSASRALRPDRLGDRPAPPHECDRRPSLVDRVPGRDRRLREIESEMEPAHRERRAGRHRRRRAGLFRAKLELHRRPGEEAVGAVEHAQLEQLHLRLSRIGLARHRLSILGAMPDPAALQRIVESRLPEYLDELQAMVNVDCGSYTPDGVNRIADLCDRCAPRGRRRGGPRPARACRGRAAAG